MSKDAVAAYVAELAGKYDTAGTERTFSTYDNRDITVSGGNYGWVIDQQKEADALYKDITEKKLRCGNRFMNRKHPAER